MGLTYESERADNSTLPFWLAEVSLLDGSPKPKTIRFNFWLKADTALEAEARLKPIVEALCTDTGPSGLAIGDVSLTAIWDAIPVEGDNTIPQYGHYAAYRGVLRFLMNNGSYSEVSFQAPVESILANDKRFLNETHPTLAALIAKYFNGTILVNGQTPKKLLFPYVQHKSSNRLRE